MISSILKWMFGSWSLERKCLFFLALALILSLFLAFAAVQSVAEQLVMEAARHSARGYASSYLGWRHVSALYDMGKNEQHASDLLPLPAPKEPQGIRILEDDDLATGTASPLSGGNSINNANSLDPPRFSGRDFAEARSNSVFAEFSEDLRVLKVMRDDMFQVSHEMLLFRLDDQVEHESLKAVVADGIDRTNLEKIYARLMERELAVHDNTANAQPNADSIDGDSISDSGTVGEAGVVTNIVAPTASEPEMATNGNQQTTITTPSSVFVYEEAGPYDGYYYYYHPVHFKQECRDCHGQLPTPGRPVAEGSSDPKALAAASLSPFRVYRIKLPYSYTRFWSLWSYSVLTSIAILTLALSLFFVHWILKRLVIRPLVYMKEVSEGITAGDTSLRFHVDTEDEFHDLSESFNAMLRHLTTTQSELQAVNQKINTQVDELARVNLELFEANRLKGEFLANMSHELRTPLNSILGFSDVLQGFETLTDKQRRYVSNIQNSGRNLLEMINDILDLAKVEAGKMQVRPTEFDIIRIIHSQCDMIRKMADDKNIDLRVDSSHDSLIVFQDQTKVQQILTNLLSNAIKFTPEGGLITVHCDPRGNEDLLIAVADTGVGIAIEDHEIIFEKFRQAKRVTGFDGLTREHSGTGLGLSIVRELCRLLGGDIGVSSQVGFGSTFRVKLPLRYTKPDEPQELDDSNRSPTFII